MLNIHCSGFLYTWAIHRPSAIVRSILL